VHVIIGRDGKVEKAEAISGPDLLRQPAVDAISQWRYRPYLPPKEVDTIVTVTFHLG
jgi:outer membrane biosynthesis protein TonB